MKQRSRAIDFLITGTPRSGTGYIAQILSYLGIECSHERMFNPWEVHYEEMRSDSRKWGDSSWMAVPYLGKIPPITKVFHIVRDPLKTINSIIRTRQVDWPSDYRAFLALHCWGDSNYCPTDIAPAAQYFWVTWNSMIELSGRVTRRFQVERVGDIVDIVSDIEPGLELDPARLEEALKAVPTTYNTKEGKNFLTESELEEKIVIMGRRYGYV
jgi:hypothetical protein